MKVLVINNYDSFVYNLVHMLHELHVPEITIAMNDKVDFNQIEKYDKILLSPGPGIPANAGVMPELLKTFAAQKSILGVCLGHQAIAENFGGTLINLEEPLHGIASRASLIEQDYLFKNMPITFHIGHYHSWVVNQNIPDELIITAVDERGNIMAIKHREYDVRGVQFHPESVLTENGKTILNNWINKTP
jgi:anthranilate synthase component II